MKVTKKAIREFLKDKLSTNEVWAKAALLRVYENQTNEEQCIEGLVERNYIGFSAAHAEILSSFAKQLKDRGSLSTKQMTYVFKYIPKYWNQIWNMSDQTKVIKMIESI